MEKQKRAGIIETFEKLINDSKITDLSYTLEPGMPAWPTQARFGSVVYESYDSGAAAIHSMITMSEHTGTHVDAPRHFIKGGYSVDELDPGALIGRAVRIDAPDLGKGALLEKAALKAFESKHGEIKEGDIVMFRFGWDKKYGLYGGAGEYLKNWPGLSKEAAEYLAGKKIAAAGSDTLAIDASGSVENPAHHVLLAHNIPIIENIANLEKIPVFSFVIGLPNKFKGGSGSPLRLIAFSEKK